MTDKAPYQKPKYVPVVQTGPKPLFGAPARSGDTDFKQQRPNSPEARTSPLEQWSRAKSPQEREALIDAWFRSLNDEVGEAMRTFGTALACSLLILFAAFSTAFPTAALRDSYSWSITERCVSHDTGPCVRVDGERITWPIVKRSVLETDTFQSFVREIAATALIAQYHKCQADFARLPAPIVEVYAGMRADPVKPCGPSPDEVTLQIPLGAKPVTLTAAAAAPQSAGK